MTETPRLIKALLRQPVDRTPVWFMRQAGRYLPEYRATREQAGSFLNLCCTPELACEVTLQPLRRYALDAAILFSDILMLPHAMGLELSVIEKQGPQFKYPVRSASAIAKLKLPDPEIDLAYVCDAVRLIRRELPPEVALIGFAGSPWTVATYMVEGQSSKEFRIIKELLYDQPKILHQLLMHVAKATIAYLNAQIKAGAQAIMIFDTWGGILSPHDYQEFSLYYMQYILTELIREHDQQIIPKILFTKFASQWLEKIAHAGCDAISIDWTVDIGEARQRVGHKVALQGNMDPMLLHASHERISQEVQKILRSFGPGSGHVFNLGHGINPDIDPEKVATMVKTVKNFSL